MVDCDCPIKNTCILYNRDNLDDERERRLRYMADVLQRRVNRYVERADAIAKNREVQNGVG